MPAEDDTKPAGEGRKGFAGFSREEVRQRAGAAAQQARAKSEFILSRAYGLFRDPKLEWDQIRAEETSVVSLLLGYVAPLTGFFSVCIFIGSVLFDHARFDRALIALIVTFIVMTALIYLIGLIIDMTAENFESSRNELAAQKVAAYSFTPFFLSGVLWLWPTTFFMVVSFITVALSAYLLYRGLPPLMKTPAERATAYAVTVCLVGLIAFIVAAILAGCMTGLNTL